MCPVVFESFNAHKATNASGLWYLWCCTARTLEPVQNPAKARFVALKQTEKTQRTLQARGYFSVYFALRCIP
jgi:hypothetical protein